MKNFIAITIREFLIENILSEKRFLINNNKFQVFSGDILTAESDFNIEQPDEWINQKYVSLFNLKTPEIYQHKGFAKYLLDQIFNYVKNELKINIITLIVYKNNNKALNLYLSNGFEIFIEYDDSYSLIKKL